MFPILLENKLFADIAEQDISAMLDCLGKKYEKFQKGDSIFLADESKPLIGILLSGKAQIIRENVLGDSTIMGNLSPGELFGETFACMNLKTIPVSVRATEKSEVLFLGVDCILHTCSCAHSFHQNLIANLLKIVAEKNAILSKKIFYLTHKTIRSRLEAYFYDMAAKNDSYKFSIPFNRNELADYLCVDRSAMCRELSNMKKNGALDYHKNTFQLLNL